MHGCQLGQQLGSKVLMPRQAIPKRPRSSLHHRHGLQGEQTRQWGVSVSMWNGPLTQHALHLLSQTAARRTATWRQSLQLLSLLSLCVDLPRLPWMLDKTAV